MAKRSSSHKTRLAGLRFAFAGRFTGFYDRATATRWVAAEGGRVVDKLDGRVDYLVVFEKSGDEPCAAEKHADRLNQGGAAIKTIRAAEFHGLLDPPNDELVAMLKMGPDAVRKLNRVLEKCVNRDGTHLIDAKGVDFRGVDLSGLEYYGVMDLDGADLRRAQMQDLQLCHFNDVRLAEARMVNCRFGSMVDCDCREADLTRSSFGPPMGDKVQNCNFMQATLRMARLSDISLDESIFREADLTDAVLCGSVACDVDFVGATLASAIIDGSDLSGADLTRADLSGANILFANLIGANLTNARLRDTNLLGADFSHAMVNGADFTGAYLENAVFDHVDTSKAKGLDLRPPPETGKPGPKALELDAVAGQASRITIEAKIERPTGRRADVEIVVARSAEPSCEVHTQVYAEKGVSSWWEDHFDSLLEAMTFVAKRWANGVLLTHTIKSSTAGSPLKGKALNTLIADAWRELFRGKVSPDKPAKATGPSSAKWRAARRKELIEDLRAPGGVKRWNARDWAEIDQCKHFRGADLSGANLDGVELSPGDFRSASFAHASLKRAEMSVIDVRKASFEHANLEKAILGGRLQEANFDDAVLTNADLENADLTNASFQSAHLTGANLAGATLLGVDFSGAKLANVKWDGARFDHHTKFPAGYKVSGKMIWSGTGADPRG